MDDRNLQEERLAMEQRKPPEYILEIFADPACARDVVRGKNVEPLRLTNSNLVDPSQVFCIRSFSTDISLPFALHT